ncbi:MAG TPA: O-antigen ligase family protein [Thermoanaerobaculaceae bacterium]|nr:O-antigen ligase family protein [Thermoanaerobaculaceae bacterium]
MHVVPTPRAAGGRLRATARRGVPAVVAALATYTFLVIGRVPDEFPSLRLALVTAGLTGVLALIGSPRDAGSVFRRAETRAVLALFGLSIATIPFSLWPSESLTFVTRSYASVVFLFLVFVYRVRSTRSVQIVLVGILAAMLFLEIALMLWGKGDRPQVTNTYDSNDIAFVMVCGLPIGVLWFLRGRGLGRYIAGFVAALAVLTVLHTRSRGGFVSLCIVMGILLVKAGRRRRLAVAAVALACILILSVFSSKGYWGRMATIWGGSGAATTSVSEYDASGIWGARWGLWIGALRLMLRQPVIGAGAGVGPVAEGLSHRGVGKWSTPHNSFLEIGVELGIPGLALFVFLLYRAVRNCRRVTRLSRARAGSDPEIWLAHAVEVSVYAYVIAGFSLSQAYSPIPYLLVAASVVLTRLASARARASDPRAAPSAGSAGEGMTGPQGEKA